MGPAAASLKTMKWPQQWTKRDALRAGSAGRQAVAASAAAQTLFEVGGKHVLPASVQELVKASAETEASRVLVGKVFASGASVASRGRAAAGLLEGGAVRAVAARTVGAAGRQVLKSLGAAAGAGAAIDGGWAFAHAVRRVRSGTMTKREATVHVVREAGTGAAATAAGTGAAVLLVALTGGVAAPALFLVAAAASLGVKLGLDAWWVPGDGAPGDGMARDGVEGAGPAEVAAPIGLVAVNDEAKPA